MIGAKGAKTGKADKDQAREVTPAEVILLDSEEYKDF